MAAYSHRKNHRRPEGNMKMKTGQRYKNVKHDNHMNAIDKQMQYDYNTAKG